MGVCARFGGSHCIASQQGDILTTVPMLTKAPLKQGGPREHGGEKAWHSPITAPVPAHRDRPNMVTRPVMPSIAAAIRFHGRRVVPVTQGCRHWTSATMSMGGFSCVLSCRCG